MQVSPVRPRDIAIPARLYSTNGLVCLKLERGAGLSAIAIKKGLVVVWNDIEDDLMNIPFSFFSLFFPLFCLQLKQER